MTKPPKLAYGALHGWYVQDQKVFKVEVVAVDHIDHIVLQWQSGYT